MSRRPILLETFEHDEAPPSQQVEMGHGEFEEARLAAFEKGYTAGWDDAIAAQEAEGAKLRSDVAQNLQDLSFTYHEAREHVLGALQPLLFDIAAKFLPALARETLAQMVAEQLSPVAESLTSTPISVVANPSSLPQIEALLAQQSSLPLVFVAEPTLGEGQVYLRFAETETRVDLDGVIALITEAIHTYFSANQQEPAHG